VHCQNFEEATHLTYQLDCVSILHMKQVITATAMKSAQNDSRHQQYNYASIY